MKHLNLVFCLIIYAIVSSCSDGTHDDYDDVAKRSQDYFEEDKKKNSKDFLFPDSVMSRSIIATYFEENEGAHSVMFYSDKSNRSATVIRYFPDKRIVVDSIQCNGTNEYVSILSPEVKYVVEPDRVLHLCRRSEKRHLEFSFDHLRTDMNKR